MPLSAREVAALPRGSGSSRGKVALCFGELKWPWLYHKRPTSGHWENKLIWHSAQMAWESPGTREPADGPLRWPSLTHVTLEWHYYSGIPRSPSFHQLTPLAPKESPYSANSQCNILINNSCWILFYVFFPFLPLPSISFLPTFFYNFTFSFSFLPYFPFLILSFSSSLIVSVSPPFLPHFLPTSSSSSFSSLFSATLPLLSFLFLHPPPSSSPSPPSLLLSLPFSFLSYFPSPPLSLPLPPHSSSFSPSFLPLPPPHLLSSLNSFPLLHPPPSPSSFFLPFLPRSLLLPYILLSVSSLPSYLPLVSSLPSSHPLVFFTLLSYLFLHPFLLILPLPSPLLPSPP